MADYPPNIYASYFLTNVDYTLTVEREHTLESGTEIREISTDPPIDHPKSGDIISRGTMWFSPEDDEKFDPKDDAFLELLPPVGTSFHAMRSGKPWSWKVAVGPEGLFQDSMEGRKSTPKPSNASIAGSAPKGNSKTLHQRPTASLGDMASLLRDCRQEVVDRVLDEAQDTTEENIQKYAATLFIQATRDGLHRAYRIKSELEEAGPKPEADDSGLPF